MITLLEPSTAQVDAIQQILKAGGGVTSDGFATGPLPGALNDSNQADQIVLSLGGVASDGTVIPTSLHIENLEQPAPFQAVLRDIGIEDDATFNTLVRIFDQNRNNSLRDFDPNADELDEVAELFAGTELLAGIGAGMVTILEPTAEQLDAILENLQEEGGLTRDGFATGTLPKALEGVQNPDQIVLSLGGIASDGTTVPSSLHIENLDKQSSFQDALRQAGVDDDAAFNTLTSVFDQNRNDSLRDFNPNAAADIAGLFKETDLLIGVDLGDEDDALEASDSVTSEASNGIDDAEATESEEAEGAQFVRFEPSAEQLTTIREALATGEVAGLSTDNFAVGTIPSSLDDLGSVRDILITEGGVDADGNHVPPSLLFDPDVLQKQANIRIASEDAFPYDAEVRNLLQRQFDQIRNDDLSTLDGGSAVDDVAQIFEGLNLPTIGKSAARVDSTTGAANDDWIITEDGNRPTKAGLEDRDDLVPSVDDSADIQDHDSDADIDDEEILLTDSLA